MLGVDAAGDIDARRDGQPVFHRYKPAEWWAVRTVVDVGAQRVRIRLLRQMDGPHSANSAFRAPECLATKVPLCAPSIRRGE
jgi:hypothetical protein